MEVFAPEAPKFLMFWAGFARLYRKTIRIHIKVREITLKARFFAIFGLKNEYLVIIGRGEVYDTLAHS